MNWVKFDKGYSILFVMLGFPAAMCIASLVQHDTPMLIGAVALAMFMLIMTAFMGVSCGRPERFTEDAYINLTPERKPHVPARTHHERQEAIKARNTLYWQREYQKRKRG